MSIKETEIEAEPRSNGALKPPARPMLGCGTRRSRRTLLPRLARQGHWDRRDFTFAFGNGLIGLTSSPPGPTQTLSMDDARDAVRAAFTTWSTVTNMASQAIRLSFREVDLVDHPDAIVEWVPPKHDAATRNATGGTWTFADDGDMTPGANGPTDPGAGAHADFPPDSVGGDDNEFEEPPIPVHFNDDNPAAWTANDVEAYALHEIGHMLGLEHPEAVAPLPAGVQAVMSNATAPTLRVLQPHDRDSIDELYGAPGPERFNWIWMKGTNPRRALKGLTREQLHDEIENTQTPAGFHISQVGAYVLPAGTRYTAVVEQGGTPSRHYATDRTRAEFGDLHAEYSADGYRLIDVSNVVDAAGVVRFNGVWAKDGIDAWPAVIAESLIDMFAELNKAKAANYRPVLINGYETPDEERWNALFVKQGTLGPPRDWKAHINFSRDEFDAEYAELGDEYDPTYIHTKVKPDGHAERWTGIWEKIGVPSREGYSWIELDFARRTQNLEAQEPGLQVYGLNAFVRPPAPSTVSLTASLDVAPTGRRQVVLGMAADANRVYVARFAALDKPPHTSERPGVLVVLDQQTLRPVSGLPQLPGQPRGVPVGFEPRSVAVNPKSGKAYVVNYGKDSYSLTVVDTASFAVLSTIGLKQAPHNVAINTQLNRVYVSNMYQQRVHVIDGATDTMLEPIVLGPGVTGVAVDEARNMLYVTVANRYAEPFANGVFAVIDDVDSREILPFVPIGAIGIDSQDVVVDPVMDRIYVANQGNIGAGPPSVTVLHRPSRSIVATIPLPGPARQIDVSTSASEMYVTTDRGDVQVIDTSSLTVTRVIPTHSAPWAIAVAKGAAQYVFVGDRSDGSVIRIS